MELIKKLMALLKKIEDSVYTTVEYSADFYPPPELEAILNEVGNIAAAIDLSMNETAKKLLITGREYKVTVVDDEKYKAERLITNWHLGYNQLECTLTNEGTPITFGHGLGMNAIIIY